MKDTCQQEDRAAEVVVIRVVEFFESLGGNVGLSNAENRIFFAGEIVKERSTGDPRFLGDAIDRCGGQSIVQCQIKGGDVNVAPYLRLEGLS